MLTREFMDRMQSFAAEEPDSLSMEQVAMCATMIGWSKETTAIVLLDFIVWLLALKEDAAATHLGHGDDLDALGCRAIALANATDAPRTSHRLLARCALEG